MAYEPKPMNTADVKLAEDILDLTELLAKNAHDNWAEQRIRDGWRYGYRGSDENKTHPNLVPYEQLSEPDKEYDRRAVLETLKAIIALGYRIEKVS